MTAKPASSPAKATRRRSTHVVHFSYVKSVIPPRCRKPRAEIFHDGATSVSVSVLSLAEAPVAIRHFDKLTNKTTSYRFALGKLWVLRDLRDDVPTPRLPASIDLRKDCGLGNELPYRIASIRQRTAPREAMKLFIRDAIRHYAIIGGRWHVEAIEPIYIVMTFGLGHNHGGTALMVDTRRDLPCAFSLLDRAAAVARATEIATQRGDSESIPIRPDIQIKVELPEAIRFKSTGNRKRRA